MKALSRFILPSVCTFCMICCSTPNCIDERIASFAINSETCSGASVIKYNFNGREVFAFAQGECISDKATTVVDKDCNEICLLGGIAGFTTCENLDFDSMADEVEVLYNVR